MFSLGLLVAAVAPSPNAAIGIGLVFVLGMMALSGGFGPVDALPGWLVTVGEYAPLGAAATTVGEAWAGATPNPSRLVALGVTIVVALLAAIKLFRWE
ncbi:hypothetical protein ER308_20385 [Egibacter rhizosphaerae]|uniref:ABC-2 type transporter transmembrane domain-containing protein n=1 Tax=Egibacter rhizosphaerae TaxID=1670831 RepID=A0A411YKG6_9ACTN|nr:ABC transporter permease [Egibacter rhizosphaerae]QBI21692.1 hypothetical protein ER308_20385 [Egibacter rhizosphaerae]